MSDDSSGIGDALRGQTLETRTVLLFGELTAAMARTVSEQLLLLASRSRDEIRLMINSSGGAFESAEALFDLVQSVEAPVVTVGAGSVAAAAALIYAAPPHERRLSLPNARYSLYQTFTAPGGDVLAAAQLIALQRRRAAALLARQTGQPEELVERDIEQRHWLSAEEAQQYGLVGTISDLKLRGG